MGTNNESKDDLESMFQKLEIVIKSLESNDITLENSFQSYNQGMNIIKECNKTIDQIEKMVMVLDDRGEQSEFR